jgi:hypothetical protein
MNIRVNINASSMAGLGPAAWNQDNRRLSIHPDVPGHAHVSSAHVHHTIIRHPAGRNTAVAGMAAA